MEVGLAPAPLHLSPLRLFIFLASQHPQGGPHTALVPYAGWGETPRRGLRSQRVTSAGPRSRRRRRKPGAALALRGEGGGRADGQGRTPLWSHMPGGGKPRAGACALNELRALARDPGVADENPAQPSLFEGRGAAGRTDKAAHRFGPICLSIGAQKGPRIGVQKGPPPATERGLSR